MLQGSALDRAVAGLPTRPHRNRMYGRAIAYLYRHDLFGRKRTIAQGRFNQRHGARVIYFAEDYVLALHEVEQVRGTIMSAWVLFPVWVDLNAVVDLRDAGIQAILGTDVAELTANFRQYYPGIGPTQDLGEACERFGRIDGLLFPSAVDPARTNLALFENALTKFGSKTWVNEPRDRLADQLP